MKNMSLLFAITVLLACQNAPDATVPNNNATIINSVEKKSNTFQATPSHLNYPWLKSPETSNTLVNRIAVPKGYKRITLAKGSFGEWLRYLPLYEDGHAVQLFDGRLKPNQSAHKAVINMDVGKADLQQCADAVMRLKSEFHYGRKEYDKIHFNYTSGDKVSFDDWRKGRRPKVSGNKVSFVNNGKLSDAYANFREYLIQIFTYAGTASLTKELKSKNIKDIMPGDVFIQGGFPGHAVLVLDVAINEKGEKLFLIGQSYMPAQEFHLLVNRNHEKYNPWYGPDVKEMLYSPEWTFKIQDLKAWP